MNEKILSFLNYIVSYGEFNNSSKFGTIHLVKYLYLADYYFHKFEGKRFTNWEWKMWDLGPWCIDSFKAIKSASLKGYLQSDKAISRYEEDNEYQLFYANKDIIDEKILDQLAKNLFTGMTRIAIEGVIKKYASNTNSLLHFVYFDTEPVMNSKKGDILDFDLINDTPLEDKESSYYVPLTQKKIKKMREKIKEILKNKKKPSISFEPRYDDIYINGINELNQQDYLPENLSIEGIIDVKSANLKDE